MARNAETGVTPLRLAALGGLLAAAIVLAACGGEPAGPAGSDGSSESGHSAVTAGPPPKAVTLSELGASQVSVREPPTGWPMMAPLCT